MLPWEKRHAGVTPGIVAVIDVYRGEEFESFDLIELLDSVVNA